MPEDKPKCDHCGSSNTVRVYCKWLMCSPWFCIDCASEFWDDDEDEDGKEIEP
jgi:transposase-like protein